MIRAHIETSPVSRMAAIHVVEALGESQTVVYTPDGGTKVIETQRGTVTADLEPFLIPESALHALYAELGRHLGAVESPVALRRDYDAERARVDKFIDTTVSIMRNAGGIQ